MCIVLDFRYVKYDYGERGLKGISGRVALLCHSSIQHPQGVSRGVSHHCFERTLCPVTSS